MAQVDNVDAKGLGMMVESLRSKRPSVCLILGSAAGGKATLAVGVTKDLIERGLSAGDLVKALAESIGGKGGGRPELAQAGAPDGARLSEALAGAKALVLKRLRV